MASKRRETQKAKKGSAIISKAKEGAKSLFSGGKKGSTGKKRHKKSLVSLANTLARIKLQRKIRKERLKSF